MSRQSELYQWVQLVSTQFACLRKSQARLLALWSFAIVVQGAVGLSSTTFVLARFLHKKEAAVRQQLREWYCEASAKKGAQRLDFDVAQCFLPLLTWALQHWPAEERRLALALDATTLADRFTILTISLLYRGCAIPLAWKVLPSQTPGRWKRPWLKLLGALEGGLPRDWTVIVLADRGLYARWLYRYVHHRLHWHPFFRINRQGHYRRAHRHVFSSLAEVVTRVGASWCGHVICFKAQPLGCTLLVRWEEGYDEPWLIVTDLPPEQAHIGWYALRAWIECGFKDAKRGGWQWQQSRITDPARAERVWLVLAVATLWSVNVGGAADAALPVSGVEALPLTHIARRQPRLNAPPRLLSCFCRGRIFLLTAIILHEPIQLTHFVPEPWPGDPGPTTRKTYT